MNNKVVAIKIFINLKVPKFYVFVSEKNWFRK